MDKVSGKNICCDEFEISYTLTLPQDLLYVVKQYLDKHFLVHEVYVEILDENHARTRMQSDGRFVSVIKKIVQIDKLVVLCGDEFVPLLDRHSVETQHNHCSVNIRRLSKVRVYNCDGIEIKFEHIYYEYNDGDSLDPLMASKQITLHNVLLDEKPIDVTCNSHLGSDEILANCRIELEYEGATVSQVMLQRMAALIAHIETNVVLENIEPFIQHTSVLNDIQLRTFADEIDTLSVHENDYSYWAVKLDGTRGRGYIINGKHIYLQLDDMRLFSGKLSERIGHNKILTVQVEFIEPNLFVITDVLAVYKFLYDNRNQFEKSFLYPVLLQQSIQFLNMHSNKRLSFGEGYAITFQTYATSRAQLIKLDMPNDGYIAVTRNGELCKIKDHKTVEMLYTANGTFQCSFGVYVVADNASLSLEQDQIYEVVIINENSNCVRVIKHRRDRIVPN